MPINWSASHDVLEDGAIESGAVAPGISSNAEVFEYRLGNRSALERIIDQYQVSTDKRSGITNDPNRADDPQYIVRLIGKVITLSLETVKLVQSLADQSLA